MPLVWSIPLALIAAIVAGEAFVVSPTALTILLLVVPLTAAMPGVLLVRRVTALAPMAWLIGPVLGVGLSGVGMLLIWAAGVHGWFTLLGGPALAAAVAWGVGRVRIPLRLPSFDRRDLVALAVALAVLPLITWAPYDHVGEPVLEGQAYRAYFTADFFWAMTVTSEVAKGHVPPLNPLLGESRLHYYWMAHFLSGVMYRTLAPWGATTESIILVNGLIFGAAFLACLYGLLRWSGIGAAMSAVGIVVAFLAASYEGLDRIWVLWQRDRPLATVTDYNIDAVTRWFYRGMPVDGLHRLLLYQPHHLAGYGMGLLALWLVGAARDVASARTAVAAGSLLALSFLFSTFEALIFSVAVALLYGWRLAAARAWAAVGRCWLVGAGIAGVGVLLTRLLQYTDPSAGLPLQVALNRAAATSWPTMLLLSFGPLLIGTLTCLRRWRWLVTEGGSAVALLVAGFAFYFFTDVPDMDDVWVGWRAGHALLIAMMVMSAAAVSAAWRAQRLRPALAAMVVLLCVPAVPTAAIDVFNAQDVWNRMPGPSFPWTHVISPDERAGLDWVKANTPRDAVVQFEAIGRGDRDWALIPAFAERRMAAGVSIAMIPRETYERACVRVHDGIFSAASQEQGHAVAVAMGIDYLFIGSYERRHFSLAVGRMARHPHLFKQVFKNNEVTIYAVLPPA